MTKSWHSQLLESSKRATDGALAVWISLQMFSFDMILDMVEAWSMHCNPHWMLSFSTRLHVLGYYIPFLASLWHHSQVHQLDPFLCFPSLLSLCLFPFVGWESWAVILLSVAFGKPSHSLSCMGYLELEHPLFQEYSAVFVHFGADVVVGEHACVCTHSGGRLSSSFLWEVSYEFLFISGSLTSW